MRKLVRNNRGAALVEFAIVSLLLITLVFGIIEFGLLMKDYLTVNQAARDGARAAGLGYTTTIIRNRVVAAAPSITIDPGSIVLTTGPANTDPSTWVPLGDEDGYNNAEHGDSILVKVPYGHPLATGSLFTAIFGGQTTININGSMVMGRE